MASEKVTKFLEELDTYSVLELAELIDAIQEKYGVTAAVAVGGGAGAEAPKEEEKTEFDVILASFGEKKMDVIKAVKDACGLNLKDAKALVESAPAKLKEAAPKAEAEELKAKLEGVGATVELK